MLVQNIRFFCENLGLFFRTGASLLAGQNRVCLPTLRGEMVTDRATSCRGIAVSVAPPDQNRTVTGLKSLQEAKSESDSAVSERLYGGFVDKTRFCAGDMQRLLSTIADPGTLEASGEKITQNTDKKNGEMLRTNQGPGVAAGAAPFCLTVRLTYSKVGLRSKPVTG